MKKPIIFISVILTFSFFLIANQTHNEEPILGSWTFEVPQAPWEYSKGSVTFEKNEENIITGLAKFDAGGELTINDVTVEDGEIRFVTVVDGYRVTAVLTIDGDQLAGNVRTYDGMMDFKAERNSQES